MMEIFFYLLSHVLEFSLSIAMFAVKIKNSLFQIKNKKLFKKLMWTF
jgi:hypothetical protein